MNSDNVYIFDKLSKRRSLLGEAQSGFNMSFVIDGTKDSCSIVVRGFEESEIEPYTILWHDKTDSWWIVSHDKVERYQNDSGFIYIHNIELLGAIELFNARDLTDCAFNDDTYKFGEFIYRLFDLSNFEYSVTIIGDDLIDLNTKVNFIKTFENYTLLSALREFLDAYNYSAKLVFTQTTLRPIRINGARLQIIPKTGVSTLTSHTMDDFDDVRETKTMSKESFGTCVVSNAENVISSIAKTYPTVGSARISSHYHRIKADNAIIKLPSKVFQANWLALVLTKPKITINITSTVGGVETSGSWNNGVDFYINPLDDYSFYNTIDHFITILHLYTPLFYEPAIEAINNNKDLIKETILKGSTIKLYNGNKINPLDGTIVKGPNVPYLVTAKYKSKNYEPTSPLIFCDKETKNNLSKTYQGIAWERGSDEITGFDAWEPETGEQAFLRFGGLDQTDLQIDADQITVFSFSNGYGTMSIVMSFDQADLYFIGSNAGVPNIQFVVNYIPMSDIKIKVDNTKEKNDIQLYNQTGKLTDNYALSKLLNSYAKEISSDTITKFMFYTNYNSVPKVGSYVYKGNEQYVINNISLTFTQNEYTNSSFGYYIEAEITMSKYVSTKSLMVNPNTNIRDYGIPQNYNVKRKQLYRDYYQLNYSADSGADYNYYLEPSNTFNFDNYPTDFGDLIAVMRLEYNIEVNGSYEYFYQLDTVKYDFNKMIYIVLDFNDNNIIGYDSQNVWSGFVISRLLTGNYQEMNAAISYTDENGNVEGFDIFLLNNETLTQVYNDYGSNQSGYSSYINGGQTLYNRSVFIAEDIYNLASQSDYKIRIEESSYKKDALEVPVFEYACQIDDSEEVLIGDNILKQYGNEYIYFYSYAKGNNLRVETATPANHVGNYPATNELRLQYSCVINYSSAGKELDIDLYRATNYYKDYNSFTNQLQLSFESGQDYAIFRHAYNPATNEEIVDLLFIIKNIPTNVETQVLKINHYKLN